MKNILPILSYLLVFAGILQAQGWAELGTGSNALNANNTIACICTDSGGIVYAAGAFTDSVTDSSRIYYVAKWDGASWRELGTGANALPATGGITSICVDATHNVYATGAFTDTNGNYYVAKWNGTTWRELGTGANALNANNPINSICTDLAGNVYAAGFFTDTSGYKYVAKWNGASWSELGTGSNALNADDIIMSIVTDPAGNIYAAGNFRYFPGGYYYVAKWNGASWSELGTGINALNANGIIWALEADDTGNIYAGGWFTDGGGNIYVAKWNGVNWSELGVGGMNVNYNYPILSICTDAVRNVYAGGVFQDINGKFYVAKWNGMAWSELGTGSNALNANGAIYTICTDTSGKIYAAGDFTDTNGMYPQYGHNYVAVYDDQYESISLISNNEDSIKVFPNPANDAINILVTDNFIGSVYSFYDVTGKMTATGRLKKNTSVNISRLPAGIYVLQVGNNSDAFKIIKK